MMGFGEFFYSSARQCGLVFEAVVRCLAGKSFCIALGLLCGFCM